MARIGKQRRSKCNMNEKMKSCNKGNNCTWVKKISMRKGYCRKGSVKKRSKYKQLPPKYFRQIIPSTFLHKYIYKTAG